MTAAEFLHIAPTLPASPGIYKYYNNKNELIYVGKAKNIKKRVSSYFTKSHQNYKTYELVNRVSRIEFTIVNNEQDAFLLENSLIKEYQPLFNINLKDDKSYPYIVIKKEPFPRVFLTRRKIKDGSQYFGPYTSVHKVRDLLDLIRKSVQLRTCKLNLSNKNIASKKYKVCLEYYLGNCKGPCENLQTEADYTEGIQRVKHLLKGNLTPIYQYYREEIKKAVDNLAFEKAAQLQKKLEDIQSYQSKSTVVNTNTGTVDVFTITERSNKAYINYLEIADGNIVHTQTLQLEKEKDSTTEENLQKGIQKIKQTYNSEASEIIVPFWIDLEKIGLNNATISLTIPKGGDKKKLLDLSQKNADFFMSDLKARTQITEKEKSEKEKINVLQTLQNDLKMSELPFHIECFDNSNLHGTNAVAAMVCFENAIPNKKHYRHFNIKTVTGIDDFKSMKEVVYRHYSRLIREQEPLPQLIIIDGGKGQLNAAMESIQALALQHVVKVIGLAKKKEEIYIPNRSEPILLDWHSSSLKLIRQIRDEVHRFGITHHRKKRSNSSLTSSLDNIKGIGEATKNKLLKHYKTISNIEAASEADLSTVIGTSKAKIVYKHFH